jgi:flagellar biosynthesis chaperone FliJ
MELSEIRAKMERVKRDIAKKEGELSATIEDLKREMNVKTVDEAYDQFDALEKEIAEKKTEKETLTKTVEEALLSYGY